MDVSGGGTAGDVVRRLARKSKDPKRRKAARAALKVIDVPDEFAHVFRWYVELRQQCARGFQFEPVQYSEILAYREAHELHAHMGSFEIGLLTDLDTLWRKVQPKPDTPTNDNRGKGHQPAR